MLEGLIHIFCFVTITVSFIYGTVICLICGRKCTFDQPPEKRKQSLKFSLPAAVALYSCGFMVFFNHFFGTYWKFTVVALMSAILLAVFVTSMAMPKLKRNPSK